MNIQKIMSKREMEKTQMWLKLITEDKGSKTKHKGKVTKATKIKQEVAQQEHI